MKLPVFFARLPRGLKLAAVGVALWLIASVPLLLYLVLARLFGEPPNGLGVPGAMGFALNVLGAVLVAGGLLTWLWDDRGPRRPRDRSGDERQR